MKALLAVIAYAFLFSCTAKPEQEKNNSLPPEAGAKQSELQIVKAGLEANEEPKEADQLPSSDDLTEAEDEYGTYYVTIADTGKTYSPLRKEMMQLNQTLALPIDTMRRYFDIKKNMIVLPENDEDEMYAGDYFPRRGADAHLSVEYLSLYQPKAGENTMALVTGIYEKKTSADSALAVLKKEAPKAFSLKAEIYEGCLH